MSYLKIVSGTTINNAVLAEVQARLGRDQAYVFS